MPASAKRVLFLSLFVALTASACFPQVGPRPSVPESGSQSIGCDDPASVLTVSASSHLDPACVYTGGVRIVASNVTFDCRGATIRGDSRTGILVESPADVTMENVTIRNCRTEGFLNGMRVTRDGFRDLVAGQEYVHALRDVLIENSTVTGSRGVGIFVDGYVTRVTLKGLRISRAGSTGVYLETGSRENTVKGNQFLDNGFIENGPNGSLFDEGGLQIAFWGTGREGLAIDGSSDNVVTHNYFHGNSAGGIFLYTNCGEYPERNRYFERRYPADRNLISQNTFDGGWNGVWVGSRMGENVYPMQCSNEPYYEAPFVQYTLDRADDNVVSYNRFLGPDYGIRVEDDGTHVVNNLFFGSSAANHAIVVGTPYRTQYLNDPVHNTTVTGNRSLITGNVSPFRWVHGVENLVDSGNIALGRTTAFCEGVPLPRGPFVMALAIGLPNPDGSIPPRPDLKLPVLGPIPPCS